MTNYMITYQPFNIRIATFCAMYWKSDSIDNEDFYQSVHARIMGQIITVNGTIQFLTYKLSTKSNAPTRYVLDGCVEPRRPVNSYSLFYSKIRHQMAKTRSYRYGGQGSNTRNKKKRCNRRHKISTARSS
eukprot:306925_1